MGLGIGRQVLRRGRYVLAVTRTLEADANYQDDLIH